MHINYIKSSKQYRRKLKISFYFLFFYAAVVLVQLGNDYQQKRLETNNICVDIAQKIPNDVSYKNLSAIKAHFQGISEAARNEILNNTPRITRWQIFSGQEIIVGHSVGSYSIIRSLLGINTSCQVKNIVPSAQQPADFTLSLTAQFYVSLFNLSWVLLSSLILTLLPLFIYTKINLKREKEKEQVLKFIAEINQKADRNLSFKHSGTADISSILNTEAQPILGFIDKTAALSERYDSEYVNRLEKNFIDLEERNAHLAIKNKNLNNQTTLKSSFFANLSHDFRTPLYTIDGYSRLLINTPLERKQLSHVNAIQIANANLLELVSNFLSLSRLEAGKIDLDYSDVDIRKMIKEITTSLSFLVIEHKNHFFIDISEELPTTIKTDAIKFRQILANLISNAVKYTHDGILYIHIACREIDTNSLAISISITDTGKGISEQDIGTIFDPYTRLDRDKTQVHGTGLGLGICKELCEIIGAKLSVESEMDNGSSFIIDLTSRSKTKTSKSVKKSSRKKYNLNVFNSIPDVDIYLPEWLKPISNKLVLNSWDSLIDYDFKSRVNTDEKILILLDYSKIESLNTWVKKLIPVAKNVVFYVPIDNLSKDDLLSLEPFTVINNNISNSELALRFANHQYKANSPEANISQEALMGYVLLLAEDNDLNRKIIEERLNYFGAKVISCPDGSAALELYKARKYHAILMDAHMPKLSGIELTEIIRNDFKDSETPIIGITASTSTVEYQHFIQAGMSDCLIKPLQDEKLIETIQKYALNDIQEQSLVETFPLSEAKTNTELTIQERIDELSKASISKHLIAFEELFKIENYTDLQNALFNEVHKLNGTLSMTSFKDLQKQVNAIEALINPMLWSTENLVPTDITSHVQKAKQDLLLIWPALKQKSLANKEI